MQYVIIISGNNIYGFSGTKPIFGTLTQGYSAVSRWVGLCSPKILQI